MLNTNIIMINFNQLLFMVSFVSGLRVEHGRAASSGHGTETLHPLQSTSSQSGCFARYFEISEIADSFDNVDSLTTLDFVSLFLLGAVAVLKKKKKKKKNK